MNLKLARLLSEVFHLSVPEIRLDLQRCDVGIWDSLKQMDLVVSLEREYEIILDIPDILRMNSVAEIIAVLKEKGVDLEC